MTTIATQVAAKELPVNFSAAEASAVIAGRKTMKRVAVRVPKWLERMKPDLQNAVSGKALGVTPCLFVPCADGSQQRLRNPWDWPDPEGVSRLWVREGLRWQDALLYDADGAPVDPKSIPDDVCVHRARLGAFLMPRWAARISLMITTVRAERLQAISRIDAQAEGFLCSCCKGYHSRQCVCIDLFWEHWDARNDRHHPWSSNPWVWVVGFKRAAE